MTLDDLGNIGEFVGAVAVVASLLYLAVQIRHNTQAVRASSYQDVAEGVRSFMALLANDETLADIYLRGSSHLEHLTPPERLQFEMLLGHFFANLDVAVELYRRRMVDDKMMRPYTRFALSLLAQPGVADYWDGSQDYFSEELRAYVDTSRKN